MFVMSENVAILSISVVKQIEMFVMGENVAIL